MDISPATKVASQITCAYDAGMHQNPSSFPVASVPDVMHVMPEAANAFVSLLQSGTCPKRQVSNIAASHLILSTMGMKS